MLLLFITGSVVAGLLIGSISRGFAFAAGGLLLLIGIGPMLALLIHSQITGPGGDRSSEGMMATFAFVFLVPAGVAAVLTGALRR